MASKNPFSALKKAAAEAIADPKAAAAKVVGHAKDSVVIGKAVAEQAAGTVHGVVEKARGRHAPETPATPTTPSPAKATPTPAPEAAPPAAKAPATKAPATKAADRASREARRRARSLLRSAVS